MTTVPTARRWRLVRVLVGAGVVMSVIVLATPYLLPYRDETPTTEAFLGLYKMVEGATTYYEAEHVDAEGNSLPPQFPNGAEHPTPPVVCVMGAHGGPLPAGGAQASVHHDGTAEQAACWDELGVAWDRPIHFMFGYKADNSVPGRERFTAWSHGDLDGDGVWSTFAREVMVIDGRVHAQADRVVVAPLE